jgi:hypothetical protein
MTSEDSGRDAAGADVPAGAVDRGEPDEWGAEPPRVPRPRTPPLESPTGPLLLDDDTWEGVAATESYHGRRRARMPAGRRWIPIALILAGLAAVVLIPLTMASLLGVNDAAGPANSDPVVPSSELEPPGPPILATESSTPLASTPATASATSTTTAAAPRTTRRPRPTTTSRPPNPPPPPPTFGPVTFEAEGSSVTRTGSTVIWDYDDASGGRIVGRVGDWNQPQGPGVIRFNNVSIPTNDTYTLSIHYVHPDNERNRSAVVAVSGIAPITTSFVGSSNCCDVKTLTVTLSPGTHTITISNSDDHAPSIDKIVISRSG